MACSTVVLPGGVRAIVCSRGRPRGARAKPPSPKPDPMPLLVSTATGVVVRAWRTLDGFGWAAVRWDGGVAGPGAVRVATLPPEGTRVRLRPDGRLVRANPLADRGAGADG